MRQVKRLLKTIYHKENFYLIHVDSRQDLMHRELSAVADMLPDNVRMVKNRRPGIWGGISVLEMLLASIEELLKMDDWKWDFVLNLSESDYPVKSNEALRAYLGANRGRNFVKSHGREPSAFVKKQGLDRAFVECDGHMWRLGPRELQRGIQVDGGSDWITINSEFAHYVVNGQDGTIEGLRQYFKYTLLPAEAFFHMALRNTRFCSSAVNNNLHLTNWNRKQGCKCQHKAIVDWCGCSPNDFLPGDRAKLNKTARRDDIFFARKFEPVISQESVDFLDGWISGGDHGNIPGWKSYWQNIYHYLDKSPAPRAEVLSLGTVLAQLTLDTSEVMPRGATLKGLREITLYKKEDVVRGVLVRFVADAGGLLELESLVEVRPTRGMIWRPREIAVSIGTDFDPKEVLFRNFFGAIGPQSDVQLLYESEEGSAAEFDVVWFDPAGDIAAVDHIALENGTSRVEETIKPALAKPLSPGRWTATVVDSRDNAVLELPFLVVPIVQNSSQNVVGALGSDEDDSNARFYDHFKGGDRAALKTAARANAARTGDDLVEWGVDVAKAFYAVVSDCSVSAAGGARFNLPLCEAESWSSLSRDQKSEITEIDAKAGNLG